MSARQPTGDRLWPVLLLLFALIGGALALEGYALRRGNQALVISVHDHAPLPQSSEDDEDEEATGWGPPLDEGHARARLLAQRGQLPDALAAFADRVKALPTNARLRDEYGFWLLSAGDEAAALQELTAARKLDSSDPAIALHLGQARGRTGDLAGGAEELRRALTLRPAFGAAQRALGKLLRRAGKPTEAIAVLSEAVKSGGNEERARAYAELGAAQLAAQLPAEASFKRAIEFAPARVELRIGIARAYLKGPQANPGRAVEILLRAAELSPDLPQVHSALGRAFERQGDDDAAMKSYEHAVRIDPDYRFVQRRLLRLALGRKELLRARQLSDQLILAEPEKPEHHFLAALVADRSGRTDDARAAYELALKKAKGNYPEALLNLGVLEKRSGRLPQALAAYRAAIALRPRYVAAQNNLGLALKASGDLAAAEAAFREAVRLAPDYLPAHQSLGELLLSQHRSEEAVRVFQGALQLRPDQAEALLGLSQALLAVGKPIEAVAACRTLVQQQPLVVGGWLALAATAEAAGDRAEARRALEQAAQIDPDRREPVMELAKLSLREGSKAAALAAWQELLERDPSDRDALFGLAEVHAASGDATGCLLKLAALRKLQPADEKAIALQQKCEQAAPPSNHPQPLP